MSNRSWKKITKLDCFNELTTEKAASLKTKLNKLRPTQTKKRAFIENLLEKPITQEN